MEKELLEILAPFGQAHVLDFWDQLDEPHRAGLAEQIRSLDLNLIQTLIQHPENNDSALALASRSQPPPAIRLASADRPFSVEEARASGEQELRAGHVAVVLVAGGQGTRLGFDHPKGMYPAGPISGASLFQIFFEHILGASKTYDVAIPLYVMTSPATDLETRKYFDEQDRFGVAAEHVTVFCQGTMPAVDLATGRLLLDQPGRLFESPDGHGGMVAALDRTGALDDMQRRGIRHLFYFQVDNPLATVCDPEFIGYHTLCNCEYTLQVIPKIDPEEKVGNVVSVDGVSRVIEYSDLPSEAAHRRNDDGSLSIWAGSIAVHTFDVEFLRRAAAQSDLLPFHRAQKKVHYVDSHGDVVSPDQPNAVKFERFIFDLLPAARRSISVEVETAAAFAPIKNAAGAPKDTAEIAQQQVMALHRRWLRAAGATVADDVRVEISPLFASNSRQLAGKIEPGLVVATETYFR